MVPLSLFAASENTNVADSPLVIRNYLDTQKPSPYTRSGPEHDRIQQAIKFFIGHQKSYVISFLREVVLS
jgi:hypothetical protein